MVKTGSPGPLIQIRGFFCFPLSTLLPLRLSAGQSVTTPSGSTYFSGSTGRPFTCTS
jgi:hypothetical protein